MSGVDQLFSEIVYMFERIFVYLNIDVTYYFIAILLATIVTFIYKGILKNSGRYTCVFLFTYYIFILYSVTVFSRECNREAIICFIPFKALINSSDYVELSCIVREYTLNTIMFIPFGIFCKIIKKGKSGYWVMVFGALISFSIEILQLISKTGNFEIDDILFNTIGSVIGYIVGKCLKKWCSEK